MSHEASEVQGFNVCSDIFSSLINYLLVNVASELESKCRIPEKETWSAIERLAIRYGDGNFKVRKRVTTGHVRARAITGWQVLPIAGFNGGNYKYSAEYRLATGYAVFSGSHEAVVGTFDDERREVSWGIKDSGDAEILDGLGAEYLTEFDV